ncbi:uncharacterized protein LOC141632128 [Silene latifolia]|uniref:uncharacterized protein LOC141632128 n=1 Tax=Silene latifolia TaxID=37657 RepID=UPI003D78240B
MGSSKLQKNNSLICVDLVLIDEEENYIHATIESGLWRFYRNKIVEGSICLIENFKVQPNKDNYRVVSDNKIMLSFIYETHVKIINNDITPIPYHKFDLMHFHKLESRRQKDFVLSDVIGVLVKEHGENNDIMIEIEDRSKQRLKVKLWNQCTQDYFKQKKKLEAKGCKIFIIVITSTRVKGPNSANLRVETSLSSKVYFNLEIPEVNELLTICSDRQDEIIVGKVKLQKRGIILDHDDLLANKKDISAILNGCKKPYQTVNFLLN